MSEIVIKAENLGKKYVIGHQTEHVPYRALRDLLMQNARTLWNRTKDLAKGKPIIQGDTLEEVWALKDMSFEIRRGEAVGIIGRNGAGKSTLLKILSRITEPSAGRVTIKGRVASLLEVGTGFHPELTGRENIYLNGTILGMTRKEIKRKFDEIVAFAEVEKYLDTPVKRYSSGMYVRLAFAVAAHLEPEILIVDEVLAVGDFSFQEKCLGKMKDVSQRERRTVLFVSHNLGAVETLCQSAICLDKGEISFLGSTRGAIIHYLDKKTREPSVIDFDHCSRVGTGEARILRLDFTNDAGEPTVEFRMGEPLNIKMLVHFEKPCMNPTVGVMLLTDTGVTVSDCRTSHRRLTFGQLFGSVEFHMRIDSLQLYPRSFIVEPWICDTGVLSTYDWIRNAASFMVISGSEFLSGNIVDSTHGITYIPTDWYIKKLSS